MYLVQCHMDYASSVWYNGLSQSLKNKLQTTQNKMIRLVLNLDARTSIRKEHFNHLSWLPVEKRVHLLMLCHVFKVRNNLAPSYMDELFVSQDTVHSYNTIFSDKVEYGLPKVKGSSSKSFCVLASKLWNSLPSFLTTIKHLNNF